MKTVSKLLSGLSIAALLLIMSTSNLMAQANPGGVEVIKNGDWFLDAGCPELLISSSSTVQIKSGNVHHITVFFDASDWCVPLPESAESGEIGIDYEGTLYVGSYLFTPSGNVKVKLVVNPNQPTP